MKLFKNFSTKRLFVGVASSVVLSASLFSAPVFAQTTKWSFDRLHSQISFSVSHMVVAEAEGKFDSFDVVVLSDKEDFTDAKVNVTIQSASVNTDNKDRDEHLRGADFFDAAKFPTITFVSKEWKKVSDKKYKLVGDFTMHGVTKTVELDAKFGGVIKDNKGNFHAGFKVLGEINRQDYGVTWSKKLDAGGVAVGDVVELKGTVELIK
ncbi:MAG: polyisoprenoid-binding protein [Candidatus Kapaibacterium sp.]|nr:MAG: polyisoprenoid-binding protein [Candidatus Kapabacteria bacterium]